MSQLILHPSHGYSIASENGGDAGELLNTLKTPKQITAFQSSLGLQDVQRRNMERVLIVVGSGMSPLYSGMSTPSWARAHRTVQLFQQDLEKTLIVPTARFTYRLLFNQILPPSTDARRISEFLVGSGISSENIVNEEWSNCTFGNAVFTRLILDACVSTSARIVVVTSSWALDRAQIVFNLLFRGRDIAYEVVDGDLSPEDETHRKKQEAIVNSTLYIPSINHYNLGTGVDTLMPSLWYLREINASTPGNIPDWFTLLTTSAVRSAQINPGASYGVKS